MDKVIEAVGELPPLAVRGIEEAELAVERKAYLERDAFAAKGKVRSGTVEVAVIGLCSASGGKRSAHQAIKLRSVIGRSTAVAWVCGGMGRGGPEVEGTEQQDNDI